MMKTGMVFDIQHFCVDDGPGIRTTVFMKGCPLRCIWCHNPEGLLREPQSSYDSDKCVDCRRCFMACSHKAHQLQDGKHVIDRKLCVNCGECVDSCPVEALRIFGQEMTVSEVLEDVLKDKPFYDNSEGGVTLSGGEPLSQPEFAIALLAAACQAGLHTCIETSGFCPAEVMEQAAQYTDLFLFDIKETDPALHQEYTGVSNERILSNLQLLASRGAQVILRCPVIPDCNARKDHFQRVAELANELGNVQEIHLEPYHPFGLDKYDKVGLEAEYRSKEFMPTEDAMEYVEYMKQYTEVEVKIS